MNDKQMIESQVADGTAHRLGSARHFREFHLEAQPSAACHDQQIEFRASMGLPEIDIIRPQVGEDLLQDEACPRGPRRWVEPQPCWEQDSAWVLEL